MIGTRLGPYEIVAHLGTGGMGEVYAAEDARLGRQVALKVLRTDAAQDRDRRLRFLQEARAASALNHPNILTVHDVGTAEETDFIATELIRGLTLRERLARGPLPLSEALEIVTQVAAALQAAHAAGIVHRDLKPENLMIRHDGIVKVLDFGLAKLVGPSPIAGEAETEAWRRTQAGTLVGTVAYMSPEQARGQEVDARTDLFSLGVVLYEMLAGRRPFTGETASHVVVAILEKAPPPLSRALPGIPAEVERLLERALEKEPDARHASAQALLGDLERLRRQLDLPAGSGVTAAPPPAREPGSEIGVEGARTIAVLPFTNMSPDADNEYFCDGLAEELLNALTQTEGLKVAARTSAFSFKGRSTSISAIGRALGVEAVLQGSVRKSGSRMRISVQLINASDGYQVWSERYDRDVRDIFEVQDEITLAVVEALKLQLLGPAKAAALKRGTSNAEAYQLYLKARFCWNQRTAGSLREAVELYKQALALDPGYALAWAGLAECYALFSWLSVTPPRDTMPLARRAAWRALELDDSLAEAHAALGVYLSFFAWDQPASERELRRAIELNPSLAAGHHWLGNIPLLAMGRFDESLAAIERARELEPLAPILGSDLGVTLLCARRYDEAVAQFQRTLALDPKFYVARYNLGQAYQAQGLLAQAIAEYEAALQVEDDPWVVALHGRALAAAGRRAEAEAVRDRLRSESARRYVPSVGLAVVQGALGASDEAFALLEQDVAERTLFPPFYAVDPVFDDLRADPRFAQLLRRVELARLD